MPSKPRSNGTGSEATTRSTIAPPVVPAIAPLQPPTPEQLSTEYVSAGGYSWYTRLARGLPPSIDDITSDFGDDLYERMMIDPTIAKCLSIFKASILEDGVELSSAVKDESEDDYKLAMTIRDEAEAMLDDMETSLDDVLWDMANHIAVGNVIAEQRFALRRGKVEKRELLQLVALKPKPRRTYAFVVDAYLNVIGIIGQRPGETNPYMGMVGFDPANTPNLLPRQKFAIATFRPHNSDPRGTSILRPAYDPWWRKRQLLPEYLKYCVRFASPSIWATTPSNAQTQPPMDVYANPVLDTGVPPNLVPPYTPGPDIPVTNNWDIPPQPTGLWTMTPEQRLAAAIMELQNGTALAVPYETVLHAMEMQGNGEAFLNAKADCERDIIGAILTQTLATDEGQHQARAAAQVHQDVLDTLIRQGKRGMVRMIRRDILRPWVIYNWGEKALSLVPQVTLGTTEEQDRSPLITAMSTVGYVVHPSQFAAIDEDLGLPVRDLTEDEPLADGTGGNVPPAPANAGQPGGGQGSPPSGKPATAKQPVAPARAKRPDARTKPVGRAQMTEEKLTPRVGKRPGEAKSAVYSALDQRELRDLFEEAIPELSGLLDAKVQGAE